MVSEVVVLYLGHVCCDLFCRKESCLLSPASRLFRLGQFPTESIFPKQSMGLSFLSGIFGWLGSSFPSRYSGLSFVPQRMSPLPRNRILPPQLVLMIELCFPSIWLFPWIFIIHSWYSLSGCIGVNIFVPVLISTRKIVVSLSKILLPKFCRATVKWLWRAKSVFDWVVFSPK